MPVTKAKSAMYAKLGGKLDTAVKKHANDPTEYGPIDLPGGIKNGVARLVECGFFEYDKNTQQKMANGGSAAGQYYFRAAGIVCEPTSVTVEEGREMKVAGLRTSIMEPICDTKNSAGKVITQEDHIENVLNEMRKLGGEEFTHGATGADLEDLAAQLKAAAPHFYFSTRTGKATPQYPNPRTFESWNGSKGLEDYSAPAPGDVQDDTGGEASGDDDTAADGPVDEAQTDAPDETAGGDDPDALLAIIAEDKDEQEVQAAQKRLQELALEAGATQDDIDNAADWDAVRAMIGGEAGEAEAADEPAVPEKGGNCKYQLLDTKTKKKKAVDCEILTVNATKRVVTLKNLTTGKFIPGKDPKKALEVSWDDIELQ